MFDQIDSFMESFLSKYQCRFGQQCSAQCCLMQYVKSVCIWSYSGPHFPEFGLNTERYGVSLCIQSECGKMRTRITPNTDTFYAVIVMIEKWKSAIDKGAFFSAPLIALSKAFDCLLHEVLLAKF